MKQLISNYIDALARDEVQSFLFENENTDVQLLVLKHRSILDIPSDIIATQLIGRQKAKLKLPSLFAKKGIVYPPSINLEQCSSEATANYKSVILHELRATKCSVHAADLTGGFGIDAWYMSTQADHLEYVEAEHELFKLAGHNHKLLSSAGRIMHHHDSAENFVSRLKETLDILYIDPSRRNLSRKVYHLADCLPDVVQMLPLLKKHSAHQIIKASPLLDISQGCRELAHVRNVFVVAVENECKELLFYLNAEHVDEPSITAVDLDRSGKILTSINLNSHEEKKSTVSFHDPLTYLYEPNASLLKAGAFKWIAQKYNVEKLSVNTHLYTSTKNIVFPGRTFRILDYVKLDKKLKDRFTGGYANIIARNYGMDVKEIKAKTGLKEGGDQYLICAQGEKTHFAMIAERLESENLNFR